MSEVSGRPRAPVSALTYFVPRQVMLENAFTAAAAAAAAATVENHKKKKKEVETMAVMEVENEEIKSKKKKKKKSSMLSDAAENSSGATCALPLERSSSDGLRREGEWREALLRSIAEFLESSGFAKTLSIFRSEAQIEVDGRGLSCVNLEDLFYKFMESSRKNPDAVIDGSKEQGRLLVEATDDFHVESKEKKRRKKKSCDSHGVEDTEKCHLDVYFCNAEHTDDSKSQNTEKQKKHKPELVEINDKKDCFYFEEVVKENIKELNSLTDELYMKTEDVEKTKGERKKKRKKEATDSLEMVKLGVNQVVIAKKSKNGGFDFSNVQQALMNLDDSANDLKVELGGSKKKDKKKQQKSTSAKLVEEASNGVEMGANMDLQKSGFNKDNIAISEDNSCDGENATHKKRKRCSSKEKSLVSEEKAVSVKLKHTELEVAENEVSEHQALMNSKQSPVKKKRKAVRSNGDSHEPSKTLSSDYLVKHEQKPITEDTQKESGEPQLANGNIEKNGKEGSSGPKSMNKEKRSSEPKTVNAFQRVMVDQVQFADERLQDNSYWALDDSGKGYGAKAQEVLGQVRGRDFRHEKTKKKRGTYRGGQIDLQSHSIKFNYSDEE